MKAAQVWVHADVDGRPITLCQMLERVGINAAQGTATWRLLDSYKCIDTAMIQDAVIWNDYDMNVIRTIVPRDLV